MPQSFHSMPAALYNFVGEWLRGATGRSTKTKNLDRWKELLGTDDIGIILRMMALQMKATTYLKKVMPIVPKLDHGSRDRITKSLTAIEFLFDHARLELDYRGYAGTLGHSSVLSDLAHLTSVFGGEIVVNQGAISKVNEEIISLIDEVNSSNLDGFLK